MANTTTKTTIAKRAYAVLDKEFTYEYYAVSTIPVGTRMYIDRGNRLNENGDFVFITGVGQNEVIPKSHFHIEVETTKKVTTTTTTVVRV